MAVTAIDECKCADVQSNRDILNGLRRDILRLSDSVGGKILYAETAFDPGDLADGAGETKVVTVTGAALGDFVSCSVSADLQDMTLTGYVQAADTVEVRLQNESGGARNSIDLGTLRVIVRGKPTDVKLNQLP